MKFFAAVHEETDHASPRYLYFHLKTEGVRHLQPLPGLIRTALLYFSYEFQTFHRQPLPARPGHAPAERVSLGIQFLGHRRHPCAVQAGRAGAGECSGIARNPPPH